MHSFLMGGLIDSNFLLCVVLALAVIAVAVLILYLTNRLRNRAGGSGAWVAQSGLGLHERTNNSVPIATIQWMDDGTGENSSSDESK